MKRTLDLSGLAAFGALSLTVVAAQRPPSPAAARKRTEDPLARGCMKRIRSSRRGRPGLPAREERVCRFVRQPHDRRAQGRRHHEGGGRGRRHVRGARQPRRARAEPLHDAGRVLPRGRDADADQRLRHQDRGLAAGAAAGTASSRRSATAAGRASSAIRRWPRRCRPAMPPRPPTPGTWAAAARSRSAIPKSSWTSRGAPSTR